MIESVGDSACPICNSVRSRVVVVENGIKVVRCEECGLVYASPRPDKSLVEAYFRNEFINNEETLSRKYIEERMKTLDREARRLRQLVPGGGYLLDIGTASGAFLSCFSHCPKWVVEGVEPAHTAVKYAKEKFGVTIHQGFLIDQHFSEASYDVVTCIDTFYYILNPNDEVREIARILKPGGLLAMEIPGYHFRMMKNTGPLCRLLYGRSSYLDANRHVYFYSRKTLRQLVERHGFKFVASFPEQSPSYGPFLVQLLGSAYFRLSGAVYRFTNGYINCAPKEFIVFEKSVSRKKTSRGVYVETGYNLSVTPKSGREQLILKGNRERVAVRPVIGQDAGAIAALHSKYMFPEDGQSEARCELLRLRYRALVATDRSFGFVHVSKENEVDGFIFVVARVFGGLLKFCWKHPFSAFFCFAHYVIERPSRLISGFRRTISVIRDFKVQRAWSDGEKIARTLELRPIVVEESVRGTAVAADLLQAVERELMKRGFSRYGLHVDKGNHRAISFYVKNGFRLKIETHRDLVMTKDLGLPQRQAKSIVAKPS